MTTLIRSSMKVKYKTFEDGIVVKKYRIKYDGTIRSFKPDSDPILPTDKIHEFFQEYAMCSLTEYQRATFNMAYYLSSGEMTDLVKIDGNLLNVDKGTLNPMHDVDRCLQVTIQYNDGRIESMDYNWNHILKEMIHPNRTPAKPNWYKMLDNGEVVELSEES